MAKVPRHVTVEFDTTVAPLTPTSGFLERCAEYGIAFDDGDLPRLGHYLALLLEANKSFNLTAIADPEQAWERHIFDSLTLLPFLIAATPPHTPATSPAKQAALTAVDIGAGGGLPSIPLAIVSPLIAFTLIESTGKKCRFLEIIVRELGLENVEIVQERAEVAGQDRDRHREQYDLALARAVGRLAVVAELATPLVKQNGRVLLIKGAKAEEEIVEAGGALRLLNTVHEQTVPTPTGRIVVLHKGACTPKVYPRKPGEPKRAPLR